MRKGKGIGGHTRANRGASDSWLTPKWVLDRLGAFGLDPCPCLPQPWPTAARVLDGDGLQQEWDPKARIWLNPPYGPALGAWLRKLADHGDGIAITFARTETRAFFGAVWGRAKALLFLKGRLHFCYPDGTAAAGNAGGPSVLVAYGYGNALRLQHSGIPGALVTSHAVERQPGLFGDLT